METMNDTPETDAEANNGSLCDQCVPVDFARKLERERDEARKRADTMFAEHVDIIDQALYDRDELRAQLREEQQLHIQTLGERDEARQWESQALVARIQRDEFSKTLGEVRDILCNAMPNENAPTSFIAATLVKERDEAQKQLLNL